MVIFEQEQAYGTLELTVVEANLTKDTEFMGKMDPFVTIQYSSGQPGVKHHFKTTVKDDAGKTPKWNETFKLEVKDIAQEKITF